MAWNSGQLLRVSYYLAAGNLRAATTRTFRVLAASFGGPAPGVLSARILTVSATELLACVSAYAELQGVAVWAATGPLALLDLWPAPGGSVGTGGNTMLPPAVTGKLRFRGSAGIPRNNGSMFIPYPSTSDNGNDARPTAAYLARLDAFADTIEPPIVASDIGPPPTFNNRTVTIRTCMLPSSFLSPNISSNMVPVGVWSTQRRRSVPPLVGFSPFG
jgi:hypothetical protein